MSFSNNWLWWALLSAGFAGATAVLAKVGIQGVDSDLATLVAPVDKLSVVLVVLFAVSFLGERPAPKEWLGLALIAAGGLTLAIKR